MARSIPEPLQRLLRGSIRRGEGQGIEQIEQSNPAVFEELHLEGACCELGKQYARTEKVGKARQDIKSGDIRLKSSSFYTGTRELPSTVFRNHSLTIHSRQTRGLKVKKNSLRSSKAFAKVQLSRRAPPGQPISSNTITTLHCWISSFLAKESQGLDDISYIGVEKQKGATGGGRVRHIQPVVTHRFLRYHRLNSFSYPRVELVAPIVSKRREE